MNRGKVALSTTLKCAWEGVDVIAPCGGIRFGYYHGADSYDFHLLRCDTVYVGSQI